MEGGQAVAAEENEREILIGPDEGALLPVLGVTHIR
jgi:hypothetical protein